MRKKEKKKQSWQKKIVREVENKKDREDKRVELGSQAILYLKGVFWV